MSPEKASVYVTEAFFCANFRLRVYKRKKVC